MTRSSSRLMWLGIFVVFLVAYGCASGGTGRRASSGPIQRIELDSVDAFMVDEAVQLLRPAWMLQLMGACYAEVPMERAELRSLPLTQILEIRQISPSVAVSTCGISGTDMMASGTYLHIIRRR